MSIKKCFVFAVYGLVLAGFAASVSAETTEEMSCFRSVKKAEVMIDDLLNRAAFKACGIQVQKENTQAKCRRQPPKEEVEGIKEGGSKECFFDAENKAADSLAKLGYETAKAVNSVISDLEKQIASMPKGACAEGLDLSVLDAGFDIDEESHTSAHAESTIAGLSESCGAEGKPQ